MTTTPKIAGGERLAAVRLALAETMLALEEAGFECTCDYAEDTGATPCAYHAPAKVLAELTLGSLELEREDPVDVARHAEHLLGIRRAPVEAREVEPLPTA